MPAAEIDLRYPSQAGSPTGSLGLRSANLVNTPLVSAAALDNGQEVSDVYHLYFHESGGTVTADVTGGPHSPYTDTGLAVVADDATPNYNLVPGAGLVVDSGTVTGDRARVSFGAYMTAGGAYSGVLNVGLVDSGAKSSDQKVAAVNIGDRDAADVTLDALPGFYFTPATAYAFVDLVDNHSDDSREDLATTATLTLTFTNWGDDVPSGKKKADVYVNGSLAINDALFDGATRYEHGQAAYDDGADRLRGLALVLADTTADPSAVTVTLVVDGDSYAWVELAPDVSGSPGAWALQTVQLTEAGKSAGTITQTNQADFWHRWAVPSTATLGALRLWNPRIKGATI